MNAQSELPFVSVIIPIYNGTDSIGELLNALAKQTYPPDRHEIIFVDNGSTDDTVERIVSAQYRFPNPLIILKETEIQGSYAARNRGLATARGEVIAFTDADCTPVPDWLHAGITCLLETSADLAGGQVTFTYASDRPTAAEMIDARTNMQMEMDILQRGVTKTANLFVWRRVFDAIGDFPAHLKSGGDVLWTRTATRSGFKLVFASGAEIGHPARSWLALFEKQYRVGKGQIWVMRDIGMSWLDIAIDSLSFRRRGKTTGKRSGTRRASREYNRLALTAGMAWSRGATLLGRIVSAIRTGLSQ